MSSYFSYILALNLLKTWTKAVTCRCCDENYLFRWNSWSNLTKSRCHQENHNSFGLNRWLKYIGSFENTANIFHISCLYTTSLMRTTGLLKMFAPSYFVPWIKKRQCRKQNLAKVFFWLCLTKLYKHDKHSKKFETSAGTFSVFFLINFFFQANLKDSASRSGHIIMHSLQCNTKVN